MVSLAIHISDGKHQERRLLIQVEIREKEEEEGIHEIESQIGIFCFVSPFDLCLCVIFHRRCVCFLLPYLVVFLV